MTITQYIPVVSTLKDTRAQRDNRAAHIPRSTRSSF